jgi:hypothetical protein
VQELRFGDNDTLSAQVAAMIHADWLILLTDVDYLYTSNPHEDSKAVPIKVCSVCRQGLPGLLQLSSFFLFGGHVSALQQRWHPLDVSRGKRMYKKQLKTKERAPQENQIMRKYTASSMQRYRSCVCVTT